MQHDDAHDVRGSIPAIREADVRHARHGRCDGAARGIDDRDGAAPVSHLHCACRRAWLIFLCPDSCWTIWVIGLAVDK